METKIKTNNLSRNILTIGQIDLQMNFEKATLPDAENYHCKNSLKNNNLEENRANKRKDAFERSTNLLSKLKTRVCNES